jgi:hypothetical protein
VVGLASAPHRLTALAAPFPTDRRFALSLALRAGLLVIAALAKLGVETGALDLPLEPAEGPLQVLSFVYEYFQRDHTPQARKLTNRTVRYELAKARTSA